MVSLPPRIGSDQSGNLLFANDNFDPQFQRDLNAQQKARRAIGTAGLAVGELRGGGLARQQPEYEQQIAILI